MRRLYLLITALIVYGSLYPWRFHFHSSEYGLIFNFLHSWNAGSARFALSDIFINLALYVPYGAAGYWALRNRWPWAGRAAAVLLSAFLLSLCMELMQVSVPGRVGSLRDLACNVAGAAVGIGLATLFHFFEKPLEQPIAAAWCGALLLTLFAAHQVLYRLAVPRPAGGFLPHEVWCTAAEWFAALLAARAVSGAFTIPLLRKLPAIAVWLCLPARLLIGTHGPLPHEILGAGLALALWLILPDRARLWAGVFGLGTAIVIQELAPFRFSALPSKLAWTPFGPVFDSGQRAALVALARKAFDYGAIVWLLAETGFSTVRSGIAVAAGLAILTAVQQYIPGHAPETTDIVLALIPTVVLSAFSGQTMAAAREKSARPLPGLPFARRSR